TRSRYPARLLPGGEEQTGNLSFDGPFRWAVPSSSVSGQGKIPRKLLPGDETKMRGSTLTGGSQEYAVPPGSVISRRISAGLLAEKARCRNGREFRKPLPGLRGVL